MQMVTSTAAAGKVSVDTHCPYCALQCAMTLTRQPDEAIEVAGRDFPVNQGGLCHKGWTSAQLLTSPDRLTSPLLAGRGSALPHHRVDWDSALDAVAGQIKSIQAKHGPDAVAVFGGGGLTNEKAYSLGKFARVVLGTSKIDYNGRFCMSSAAAANNRSFGIDRGLPFPVTDLADTDVIMLVGANVAETMPPFIRHVAACQRNGGTVIAVDPRRSETARLADVHLQGLPGSDLALALALLHVVIADNLIDEDYIEARTTGFAAVRARAAHYWPERVERETGIAATQLRHVAALLGRASRAVILTARGPEQQSKGTDTVTAFINLALALGLPGRQASGYGTLTGQGNGQGGREHGQKADQLPGYRSISDPAAREHVAKVWDVDPDSIPGPGVSAYELLDSLGTTAGPKALLVFGSNPVICAPRATHIQSRLAALDLLVVADPFMSETAALADVVLPVAQWAEEEGTMTNLEGRVIRRHKLMDPPPGVRTDLEVMAGLSARLGKSGAIGVNPAEVFDELARASAGGKADYSGMTHAILDERDGAFWPWPAAASRDTPRMFQNRFPTQDGRARFIDVDDRPVAEPVDDEFPIYLTTGRVLSHYQSGTQTRRVPDLVTVEPTPFVEMHPSLARRTGVVAGQQVRVTSRRGEVQGLARLTEGIRLDTIFMPFHWAGTGRVNAVTNPALDPISGMPEFKMCAVRVEAVDDVDDSAVSDAAVALP